MRGNLKGNRENHNGIQNWDGFEGNYDRSSCNLRLCQRHDAIKRFPFFQLFNLRALGPAYLPI
jgi:hypothetical protein